jgi:hypothetical protein
VKEPELLSSCSFDCNVYMWDTDTCSKIGSLELGQEKHWDINVDKV